MHNSLHGVTFSSLDSTFQIHEKSSNNEFMGKFCGVSTTLLPSDEGKQAFHQHVQFSNRIGNCSDDWCLNAIKNLNLPMWW